MRTFKKWLFINLFIILGLITLPYLFSLWHTSSPSSPKRSLPKDQQVSYPEKQLDRILEGFKSQNVYEPKVKPSERSKLDKKLAHLLQENNIEPLESISNPERSKIKLGHWLFFERNISGFRNMSCSMCHAPTLGSSDGLSLSIGGPGFGFAIKRTVENVDSLVPRNSLDLFNRGQPEISRLFWDGRVHETDTTMKSPAKDQLPENMKSPLAVLSIIPLVANKEMRGTASQKDVFNMENKLATYPDTAFRKVWDEIVNRIKTEEEYRETFRTAFSDIDSRDDIGIRHVGEAIAAFIRVAFSSRDSPWDRYLMGDIGALSAEAKKGGILFYDKANCYTCHSGDLMTDQEFHNIGVPQLGPGVSPDKPWDFGAYRTTGKPKHKFAFRTPPLRNVALTGPWMHNGAYKSLEGAVRHHIDPRSSLRNYNAGQLDRNIQLFFQSPLWIEQINDFPKGRPGNRLAKTLKNSHAERKKILSTLDPKIEKVPVLTETEIDQLIRFLVSLTSPRFKQETFSERLKKSANLAKEEYRFSPRRNTYLDALILNITPSGFPTDCRADWCER